MEKIFPTLLFVNNVVISGNVSTFLFFLFFLYFFNWLYCYSSTHVTCTHKKAFVVDISGKTKLLGILTDVMLRKPAGLADAFCFIFTIHVTQTSDTPHQTSRDPLFGYLFHMQMAHKVIFHSL